MAFGLPERSALVDALQAQVQSLQDQYGTVPSYATFTDLPDPAGLPDGALAHVVELLENGQAGLVAVRTGQWTIPVAASPGTVSFVCAQGAGAGELPEDLVVAQGATVPLGITGATPWALVSAQTIARPSGVVVTPIDPSNVEVGARGAGIWRFAVQVNYDATVPNSGLITSFVVQRDTGSGFADVPNGEIIRLNQSSPASVDGLTQVGFFLNISVSVGDKFRIAVRHDDDASRTYTVRDYIIAANQLSSPLT